MRYRALFVPVVLFVMAGAGVACQVSVNGGTGTDPNTPANANNTAATATTPAATGTTAPTGAPVDTTPGVRAPRLGKPAGTATGTTANPGVSPRAVMTGGNDFGSGTQTPDSFTGQIYFLPPATQKVPDFSAMQPSGVLYTRNFDIGPRNFDKGFPGIDARFEWFAIRYTGTLTVAAAGAYGLKVLSDDGAVITIDGNKALDNDGMHAPKTATSTVNLTSGTHTFQLDYFQGPRFQVALQVWVTPPAGGEKLLTNSF